MTKQHPAYCAFAVLLVALTCAALPVAAAQEEPATEEEVPVEEMAPQEAAPAEPLAEEAASEEAPMEEAPAETPVPEIVPPVAPTTVPVGPLTLTSSAFSPGAPIPTRYSCDGADVSPALAWTEPPSGTESFALIMHDPDAPVAGGWTHWVLYDLPAAVRVLGENVPRTQRLDNGGVHGNSSWRSPGYGGPCPPSGDRPHTYRFTLHALSAKLNLAPGATRDQVLSAIRGRVLAETTLTGTYQRR